MITHESINYLEFPAFDLPVTKAFFSAAFDWNFVDYGPDYTAFTGGGMDGGFYQSDLQARAALGSVLVVLYSQDLAATQAKVEAAGGTILQDIFEFPGGQRFHFAEPSGNEFAVWSDQG